jgi:hypothetical protein
MIWAGFQDNLLNEDRNAMKACSSYLSCEKKGNVRKKNNSSPLLCKRSTRTNQMPKTVVPMKSETERVRRRK